MYTDENKAGEASRLNELFDGAPQETKHRNHWKYEDAQAANDIELPECIHGMPRNVFCGKCES